MEILDPTFLRRVEALNRVLRKVFVGGRHGETPVARYGHGTLFHDFRPYVAGDDLRYVDWNIFARLGSMVVKQFEAEESPEIFLLIDVSRSMDFGQDNKLDYARMVAGAIGYVALANLGTVRFGAAPPDPEHFGRTYRGLASTSTFLKHLAAIAPRSTEDSFAAVVESLSRVKRLPALVLLSDFYDVSSFSRLAAFLRHRRTRTYCFHLVCREELSPDGLGDVLVDAESGRKLRVSNDQETVELYRKVFRRHCLQIESECKKGEIRYTRVDTRTPFLRAVMAVVQAARGRG